MDRSLIPFTKVKCEKSFVPELYTTGKVYEVDENACITADNGSKTGFMPNRFTLVEENNMTKWRNTTSGGYDVVIHTENGKGSMSIVGQYLYKNIWFHYQWNRFGKGGACPNAFDLVPEVDVNEFNIKVLSTIKAEDLYYVARQWFIDHPEELN